MGNEHAEMILYRLAELEGSLKAHTNQDFESFTKINGQLTQILVEIAKLEERHKMIAGLYGAVGGALAVIAAVGYNLLQRG